MASLTLEGDTLGEKHRNFNKLVEKAVANEYYQLRNISADDSDIENLLKIDIACKTRNVDYIIEVMKSNDMLYAATAIKKSTWLVTEPQYANIINPDYLHTQLLPSMNTKTFNKLMLHIRLNLKDETRVETFYEYLKQSESAYKWLEHCSIPFIENVIKNERIIPQSLFIRLCRRSVHFLTYYKRVVDWDYYDFNRSMLFLMKSYPEQYFNFVDEQDSPRMYSIGKKKSEILMKANAQRIFDKFEKYEGIIDATVVVKYLKTNEIKSFMFKEIKRDRWYLTRFDKISSFVINMPEEEKLEFIRQTFIDRTDLSFLYDEDEKEYYKIDVQFYEWYKFFPFNVAFPEMKKLILAENSPTERCAMLCVLIKCARKNPQHIKTLLQFSKDRHINEPFNFKIQFINNLLSQVSTHEFDVETWNILDQLFHSMEVYTESEKNVQQCLQSIVLYKVLRDEPVPEIVEKKIEFDTFEKVQRILNQEQNNKIFTYLLNSQMAKIRVDNIVNESDFDVNLLNLKNVFTLINDWKKDISCYPLVLKIMQELVNIKQQKPWKIDSELYSMNKSWRKHMFEESLSLCLNEEACLNALKHKPQLLTRHDKQIETLRTDDAVSLPRLLAKLRIYWPHSLAQYWIDAYLLNLNKPTGQKAVIKGLFALLPQSQIIDLLKKHAPNNFKINWGETDQTEIIVRKNIAKHLHVARPVIPLDTVLWYAKGDYLQFTVPSLNAIVSKLSKVETHNFILKLLEAPVSLRKLGIHFVISKLKPSEMKTFVLNIWNSTTNSIIRAVIFKNTYHRLCKVKNTTAEKELWAVLSTLFDTLTKRENKVILNKCLSKIEDVPISVRAEFYMKSYTYLSSLPQKATHDRLIRDLVTHVRSTNIEMIDSFDDDFVINTFLSPAGTKFCTRNSGYIDIFSRFVMWGKTEEDQLLRFRKVIDPAMEEVFVSWRKAHQDDYYVKSNFNQFTRDLMINYKEFTLSKKTTPAKLFTEIKNKMEKGLDLLENYTTYTSWKLITEYAKLMELHISEMGDAWLTGEQENIWNDIHVAIYPALALQIVKCLKEDTDQYFPSISLMFADAFDNSFDSFFLEHEHKLEILKHMLIDPDFTPSYLIVSKATYKYYIPESSKKLRNEIRKTLESHPCQEVQMHYYHDFEHTPPDEIEE